MNIFDADSKSEIRFFGHTKILINKNNVIDSLTRVIS